VRHALFKLDQRAHTATLHAFAEHDILLLEPLLSTSSSCALFFAVQRGTEPLVVKKLTFADSDRQPRVPEHVGYDHIKKLGLSRDAMLACHLTPFELFDAGSPPGSKETTPVKQESALVGPATPVKSVAAASVVSTSSAPAPPPGKTLYRTPVKVRPQAAEDATAEAAPMRKWCWMPRYPVTLEQLGRPMPVLRATTVIEQMSIALRKLHSEGLAHMDVKPSNIFVTPDGQLLLGDFGCVRRFGDKVGTTAAFVPQDMQKQSYTASALHDWWMLAMTVSDVHLAQTPSREPGAGASEARTEQVRSTLRSMRTTAADNLLEQLH